MYESEGHYQQMMSLCDSAAEDAAAYERDRDVAAGIWRTREGHPVHISAMTESHLRNSLAMLRRKGCIGPKTLAFYLTGPKPRGEMAQQAYEHELAWVLDAKVNPYVDLLEAEMKRRGLTEVLP